MCPKTTQSDPDITLKRPIIPTKRRTVIGKLWGHFKAWYINWHDILIFAAWNRIPPSRRFADDQSLAVDRTPRECDHCPYSGIMVDIYGGVRCPKCFATYVELPSRGIRMNVTPIPPAEEDPPTLILWAEPLNQTAYTEPQAHSDDETSNHTVVMIEAVSQPLQGQDGATQPFRSRFRTGELGLRVKYGDITMSGPLSIAGLPRLQWRDGSPCDTGQMPAIRKTLLIPERTSERNVKSYSQLDTSHL